jgi:hypothetical protein
MPHFCNGWKHKLDNKPGMYVKELFLSSGFRGVDEIVRQSHWCNLDNLSVHLDSNE